MDEKDAVGIKLFETEFEQAVAMQQGLRRLLLLNVPSPIKYLHEKLPNKAKLGLYFTPFGRVLDLIDDCIACAVDKLIADFGGFVWDEACLLYTSKQEIGIIYKNFTRIKMVSFLTAL